jgi:CRP/FNR family transcriptional regulator, cyclic AMP receptor protein
VRLFTKDTKVEALRGVPLFEGLSKKELTEIANASEDLTFEPGRALCKEGRLAREFFVLIDGTAEVTKNGKKIDTRSGGDFVGEIALIMHQPRSATVTAITQVRCFVLTSRDFRRTLDDNPSIEPKIMRTLAERLVQLSGESV